ncbi:MAG: hypothetical protein HRT99_04225 [Mycoplasmatales bacterium]|nr:hypothetical protein [Mycoplasmatales bacterium]
MIKNKIALNILGSFLIVTTPLVAVVSCGANDSNNNDNTDKNKSEETIPKMKTSETSIKDNVSKGQRISDPTDRKNFSIEQINSTVNTNLLRNNDPKIQKAENETTNKIFKENYYAPYYDMGYSDYNFLKDNGKYLIDSLKSKGIKNIRLGFITAFNPKNIASADSSIYQANQEIINLSKKYPQMTIPSIEGQNPLWFPNHLNSNNNDENADRDNLYQFLTEIRKAGMDYTYSFGGWNDNSLAADAYLKKYSANDLKNLYAAIIDKTSSRHLDFDIEGTEDTWPEDFGLNPFKDNLPQALEVRQLRLDALKLLKMDPKYKDIRVTFTIPTDISSINSANNKWMIEQGLRDKIIDEIDIMTMDFWQPNKKDKIFTLPGEMGLGAINAANSLKEIIKGLGFTDAEAYSKIGIIPMYGINDSAWEVFDITSAILLNNWAVKNNIKSITGWSGLRETKQHVKNQDVFQNSQHKNVWNSEDLKNGEIKPNSFTTGLGTSDFAFSEIFSNFNNKRIIDASKYSKNDKFDFNEYLKTLLTQWNLSKIDDIYLMTKPKENLFTNSNGFIPVENVDEATRNELFDKEKTIWNLYINS